MSSHKRSAAAAAAPGSPAAPPAAAAASRLHSSDLSPPAKRSRLSTSAAADGQSKDEGDLEDAPATSAKANRPDQATNTPAAAAPAPSSAGAPVVAPSPSVPVARKRPLFIPGSASASEAAQIQARVAQARAQEAAQAEVQAKKKAAETAKQQQLDDMDRKRAEMQAELARREKTQAQKLTSVVASNLHSLTAGGDQGDSDMRDERADDAEGDVDPLPSGPMAVGDTGLRLTASAQPLCSKRAIGPPFFFRRAVSCPPIPPTPSSGAFQARFKFELAYPAQDPERLLEWLSRDLPLQWAKCPFELKNEVRRLLWSLTSFADVATSTRANEALEWILVQGGQAAASARATRFFPTGMSQFYAPNAAKWKEAREAAEAQPLDERPWVPMFEDLLDVCRAWGAEMRPRSDRPVDARVDANLAFTSSLFTASGVGAVASVGSSSPASLVDSFRSSEFLSCFNHTLNAFALHLLTCPHSRIFRSMAERYDAVLLMLRLTLDVQQRHEELKRYVVLQTIVSEIVAGIQREAEGTIDDEQFTTLVRLFLAPLGTDGRTTQSDVGDDGRSSALSPAAGGLSHARILRYMSSEWSPASLLHQVVGEAAMAIARSIADQQVSQGEGPTGPGRRASQGG